MREHQTSKDIKINAKVLVVEWIVDYTYIPMSYYAEVTLCVFILSYRLRQSGTTCQQWDYNFNHFLWIYGAIYLQWWFWTV